MHTAEFHWDNLQKMVIEEESGWEIYQRYTLKKISTYNTY